MSRKKLKVTEQPMDREMLGKMADLVWTVSQSTSTQEEKAAAHEEIKEMGGYFADKISAVLKEKK